MRIQLYTTLLIAGLALHSSVTAQKFQEPTKEELQMTADPKAPGAPAVYLYLEEKTDNRSHYISSYARIKVLTELGKEYATVEVPYVAGFTATPIIEARTIHSDGKVFPLVGKAEDLLVAKTNDNHVKVAVFNLPSVEVGSILEYKWSIPIAGGKVTVADTDEGYYGSALAGSMPEWDVQRRLYIHKAQFYFQPYSEFEGRAGMESNVYHTVDGEVGKYLLYTQSLPPGVQVSKSVKEDFTLDVQDIPAIRSEAHAPPENGLWYKVRFYYSPYGSAQIYWDNESSRWSKNLDQFAGTGNAIRSAAAQITAAATTPEDKARKLYDAVQALENTDFARAKSEEERKRLHLKHAIKKAEDVWNEKSGSGDDLSALYLALVRAAGLQADGLKVADRRRRLFDPNYLTVFQLDDLLVILHIDGKDIYTDPGQKLCPFGQLAWNHELVGGMAENSKTPVYTPPNATKDAVTAHAAELTLDAQGGIAGTVKILMNGPAALHYRQLNLTADPDEVKKQFNEWLRSLLPAGVTGEATTFQGLDTSGGYLSTTIKVTGQIGSVTGKRLLLPGFFFSTGARTEFVSEEKREAPVDLHYAEQIIDDAVYHLPAGYTVESAPAAAQLPWPEHATLVVKTAPAAGTIDIKHIFARAFVLLDSKEYPALRDYYQKLATTDQQQLVLVKN